MQRLELRDRRHARLPPLRNLRVALGVKAPMKRE